ncbi:MAG: alanine racemase [Pseudomonadota bacterium]
MYSRWVEIDLDSLRENFHSLQRCLGNATRIMAVVKSDAYGHGMVPAARCLADEGATAFGVAEVGEGVMLRREGIAVDIAVFLGAADDEVADVVKHNLQPVVFDTRQVAEINRVACKAGVRVGVHLKIDTGMGRIGILPREVPLLLSCLREAKNVYPAGVMSHCPLADGDDAGPSVLQNTLFAETVKSFDRMGGEKTALHIANSAALLRFPDMHWDMVRPGLSLYGCHPADHDWARKTVLKPVMSFKTRVLQVKEVPAGFGVSYGHTFVTSRNSLLAVLPVGYNDGYLRSLSNKAEVLVRGRRAPQRGRVCMNATVIDVTDIPGVVPGDEVTLMGRQQGEEITADELAGWMGTISYEVLCLFGNRNKRVYL